MIVILYKTVNTSIIPILTITGAIILIACSDAANNAVANDVDSNTDSIDASLVIHERTILKDKVDKKTCFIVISKRHLSLRVYEVENEDTLLVAIFPVCLSRNFGQKEISGDMKTPECSIDSPFVITHIQDASTWTHDFGDGRGAILSYGHWFLRLKTGFSGIGIHGSTNNEQTVPGRDSEGCIRLKDDDIIFLKEHYATEGMKVIIRPEDAELLDFEKTAIRKIQ